MNYITNTEELTSIADAIREKGGTSAPLEYPEEYVSAIEAISGGGGDDEDGIIMRTISGSYANDRITNVGIYAFYSCTRLTEVSIPNCTTIGFNAFETCYALTTLYAPSCYTVDESAFYKCSQLTQVDLTHSGRINAFAFRNCISLSTLSLPNVNFIADSAFYDCVKLVSLYLMGSTIPILQNSGAFESTPIGGYSASARQFGSIFVPASLYNSYISAYNWSRFSSRFVSV